MCVQEANGDIRIIAFSEDTLQHLLPATDDIIRGYLHLAGWHLQKIGDRETQVTLIQELDLKGSIPKSAISATNDMQAEQLKILPKVIEKFLKKTGRS